MRSSKYSNKPKRQNEERSDSRQEMFLGMIKANQTKTQNQVGRLHHYLASQGSETALSDTINESIRKDSKNKGINVTSKPKDKYKKQCQVCCRACCIEEMTAFGNCGHMYCTICLSKHVKQTINSFKIVKCLDEDCSQQLDISSPHIRSLELPLQEKYYKIRILFNDRKDQDIRVCPSEDCDGFIRLSDENMQCPMCLVSFCKQCLLPRHSGSCDDNGARYLTGKFHYRRCKCGLMVERNEGCQHMTCRCGYQFCYLCGNQWAQGHICPPPPAPINARAIPSVQPQLQPRAQVQQQVQPQAQASNTLDCVKQRAKCIILLLLFLSINLISFQFIYSLCIGILVPVISSIAVFLYSLGVGAKEMVDRNTCLEICLLSIFLIIYHACRFSLTELRSFFRNQYIISSERLFPISIRIIVYVRQQCCS